jgi:uncharacterized protein
MDGAPLASRLRWLPAVDMLGREVRVAEGFHARLLGLAFLDRDEAGSGLLIPRCASVHTFGMRFPLDLFFLDEAGTPLAVHRGVRARRFVSARNATTVLEIPALAGGEFSSHPT